VKKVSQVSQVSRFPPLLAFPFALREGATKENPEALPEPRGFRTACASREHTFNGITSLLFSIEDISSPALSSRFQACSRRTERTRRTA
jgi:hypothetical protein